MKFVLDHHGYSADCGAIACRVTEGRREVLGIAVQPSEAEVFWDEFLRSLADRGLRGTRLIIADDHKGLKAAAAKVLGATVQRCRVGLLKNAERSDSLPLRLDREGGWDVGASVS